VSEASLARVVNEIRESVEEEDSAVRVIRTVHGYGYAFGAEAVEEDSAQSLVRPGRRPIGWLTCGARQFALWPGEQTVGRDADNGICLESPKVSRRHARIVVADGRLSLEDLHSKNGTFVRGVRVSAPVRLEAGDQIQIGPFTLVFGLAEALGPTETQIA